MKTSQHSATHLFKEFCRHYNNRNIEDLLNLFCSTPTYLFHGFPFWKKEEGEMHQGLQDLKNLLLQGWEQSREIHLHLNSFLKTSSGVDCWASGLFTILEKMENGMQPTSTLTGILYGKLENDIWKIDELRFVPLFFPSLSI